MNRMTFHFKSLLLHTYSYLHAHNCNTVGGIMKQIEEENRIVHGPKMCILCLKTIIWLGCHNYLSHTHLILRVCGAEIDDK